ncbi:MAG: tripartite tricarboxylate transporter TctB family protein [Rhodospirillales bacterium]|nr:MAG: tripartite tricarboxylate transporter TctB family protein [Rhodospirillales bacterium]
MSQIPPEREKLLHTTDLVVALIILAICGVLYYVTTTFEEVSAMLAQNVPPEFVPQLVIIIIAILTLGIPFEHLLHKRRGGNIDSERSDRIKRMPYVTAGLLIVLVVGIPYLGMLLTMIGICAILPLLWGERRLKLIIPFAILFPLAVAYLFNKILLVFFEPGVLGIAL